MRGVSPLLFQRHSSKRHTLGIGWTPYLPIFGLHLRGFAVPATTCTTSSSKIAKAIPILESSHWCSVVSFLFQSQDSRLVCLHTLICPAGGGTFLNNPFPLVPDGISETACESLIRGKRKSVDGKGVGSRPSSLTSCYYPEESYTFRNF